MKRLIAILAIAIIAPTIYLAAHNSSSGSCGVERQDVKTLTDSNANLVNLHPYNASISRLITRTKPNSPSERVLGAEYHVFRISGVITFAKVEADSDVHLVAEATNGDTLIMEAVSPNCASGSRVESQIASVRSKVDSEFSLGRGYMSNVQIPFTATGVGFFDRIHGQTGVALNGFELHPLTDITFTSGKRTLGKYPVLNLKSNHVTD